MQNTFVAKPKINPRLLRIAQIISVVAVLNFVADLVFTLVARAHDTQSDFRAFYDGAMHIRAGLPLYPASVDFFHNVYQYTYTPWIALLITPFTSYNVAWWYWGILSIVCWLVSLVLLARELAPALRERIPTLWQPVLIAGLINFTPVSSHIFWGQAQLLLLALLTGSWLALRHKRPTLAGGLLGAAIAIKLFPIMILLPLLLLRQFRCVAAALLTAGFALVLGYALIGWPQALIFFTSVLPAYNASVVAQSTAHTTITAMLTNAFGYPTLAAIASFVVRLGIIVVIIVAAWRTRDPSQAFALGATTLFLVTPVVWEHYFVLAYLPLLDALARASTRQMLLLVVAYFLIAAATLIYNVPHQLAFVAQMLPISGSLLLLRVQYTQSHSSTLEAEPSDSFARRERIDV